MLRGLAAAAACALSAAFCTTANATIYQGTHAARLWERHLLASQRTTLGLANRSVLAAQCGLFPAGAAGAVPLYVCHFEVGRTVGTDPPRCVSVVYFVDNRIDPSYPARSISCLGAPA